MEANGTDQHQGPEPPSSGGPLLVSLPLEVLELLCSSLSFRGRYSGIGIMRAAWLLTFAEALANYDLRLDRQCTIVLGVLNRASKCAGATRGWTDAYSSERAVSPACCRAALTSAAVGCGLAQIT